MTNRSASEGQQDRRLARGRLLPWMAVLGLIWGVVLVGMWSAVAAAAAETGSVVLQAVDISPLAGNRLQLRFRLSGPPKGPPSSFTINEPARIVLDFLDTTNGLSARQQAINVGVADKISVLEGADRTRASLNLARLVPYNVQVQGNAVVLTLENAGAGPTRTPAPTPVAAVKAAAASSRQVETGAPVATPRRVSDVGFKRGPGGQGVITTRLSHPSIAVDVRQEGNQIIADFQKATLARGQERRLDVADFATPVMTVEALNRGDSARLNIRPNPPFEYLAYQANDLYVIEVRPPQKSKEEEDKEAEFDPSKKKYAGDLLSLNFQDIEVRAILQILADFTG
ncbi:MAG: type pilus assembly protein PilQ, partial [Proteobacteria bacterium]|nr:type pilus assembly protein PilQ [Pseudomonadota bacterium]